MVLDVTGVAEIKPYWEDVRSLGIRRMISREGLYPAGAEGLSRVRLDGLGAGTAAWVRVEGAPGIQRAMEAAGDHEFVVVECLDWKVVPLENLLAEFRRRGGKLYAYVGEGDDVELALTVLERGVDGIVVPVRALSVAKRVIASLPLRQHFELQPARVRAVSDVGSGERVCVDTASLLSPGEGMLVGSRSGFFFLVHGETIPSEYMPPRPFRVNAGAVHSYLLVGGGRTKYLSELRAGDRVLVVGRDGVGREVVVGRVKIERRPLRMVVAAVEGQAGVEGGIMLQRAETIRLVGRDGSPIPVTELKEGDEVLVNISPAKARHMGLEVDEFILEW